MLYTRRRYFIQTVSGDAEMFEYTWFDDLIGWPSFLPW